MALLRLKRANRPASGAFIDWLKTQKQSPNTIDRFWNVVLVSALSEDLDRIDFYHARKVFLDGFLQGRHAWKVQLLKIPLGEFYDRHLQNWLKERAATIDLLTGLKEFLVQNEHGRFTVTGAQMRDGSILKADHYLLAVSHDRARSLLPDPVSKMEPFSKTGDLESAPITSVHLWFDQPVTQLRHAVLINRLAQWIFNRTAILEQSSPASGYYYQVVISNSREIKNKISNSQEKLVAHIIRELGEIWPRTRSAGLLHSRVITEHRAVFSVTPGVEKLRPSQQTPIWNLQIAGDWTDTGWPSTMESAVRSGFLAANNIINHGNHNSEDNHDEKTCTPPQEMTIQKSDSPKGWKQSDGRPG